MVMELISSPSSHFIPGHSGYSPQYKYRLGDTYGTTTQKVLLDPRVQHAEKLILSDRIGDDYNVFRPSIRDIDVANDRYGNVIYKHPALPGYEGFVPKEHGKFGQTYTIQATEALSDFEKIQNNNGIAMNQITKIGFFQDNKWDPTRLDDKSLTTSQFKLPLLEVRPECAGFLRNLVVPEPCLTPPTHSLNPYFLDSQDPSSDSTGHVPFGYAAMGKPNEQMSNSTVCDFVSTYRKRLSSDWAPVQIDRPEPPLLIQPSEIYHRHVGQLPKYGGHIPGAIFRYGKTYGNDTRDAKRWLRGDFAS